MKTNLCPVCGALVRDRPPLGMRCDHEPPEESPWTALDTRYLAEQVRTLEHRLNCLQARFEALYESTLPRD